MKRLLVLAIALVVMLPGCAAEEAKQTEQPAQTQDVFQTNDAPSTEAEPGESTDGSVETNIDDAPNVDPKTLLIDSARPSKGRLPSPTPVQETEVVAEDPAPAEVHLVSLNSKSRKYHEPGCRYYGCNSCDEVSYSEAVAAGGVPCKKCH